MKNEEFNSIVEDLRETKDKLVDIEDAIDTVIDKTDIITENNGKNALKLIRTATSAIDEAISWIGN